LPVDLLHERTKELVHLLCSDCQPLLRPSNSFQGIAACNQRQPRGSPNQGAPLLLLGTVEAALPAVVLGPAVLLALSALCTQNHVEDSGPYRFRARFLRMVSRTRGQYCSALTLAALSAASSELSKTARLLRLRVVS
jgi:hypothetical protein